MPRKRRTVAHTPGQAKRNTPRVMNRPNIITNEDYRLKSGKKIGGGRTTDHSPSRKKKTTRRKRG